MDFEVINGDCLDVLPYLDKDSISLFVTSPPYAQGKSYEQGLDWDGLYDLIDGVAKYSYPLCKDSGFFFVNFGETTKYPRTMAELYNEAFTKHGWLMHSRRIWAKNFGACSLTGAMINTTIPAAEWEYLWTFRKPPNKKEVIRDRKISLRGIWSFEGQAKYADHPATFPVGLPANAIRIWSDPDDIVCDVFSGTGTTGVAAIENGRKYIGIERDKGWYDVSIERLNSVQKPLLVEERVIQNVNLELDL